MSPYNYKQQKRFCKAWLPGKPSLPKAMPVGQKSRYPRKAATEKIKDLCQMPKTSNFLQYSRVNILEHKYVCCFTAPFRTLVQVPPRKDCSGKMLLWQQEGLLEPSQWWQTAFLSGLNWFISQIKS